MRRALTGLDLIGAGAQTDKHIAAISTDRSRNFFTGIGIGRNDLSTGMAGIDVTLQGRRRAIRERRLRQHQRGRNRDSRHADAHQVAFKIRLHLFFSSHNSEL